MLMQCLRACSVMRRNKAEDNQEITAEVQGNYPKFKQNLAQEKFVVPKVNETQPLFGKGRLRATRS